MAIMGFLVHTNGDASAVEAQVAAMPEMTTYGIHQDCYVVAVAEASAENLETVLAKVHALDGVLTTYVTSLSMEDELDES